MRWLGHAIVCLLVGATVMFALTMFGTSIYAFFWWDMSAWGNVIDWLHPKDNIIVRIVSFIGLVLSIIYGAIASNFV